MKICFLGEYPPSKSIIANHNYILAKTLGKQSECEVYFVTDAIEKGFQSGYEIDFENYENLLNYQPQNVFVHSLNMRKKDHPAAYSENWKIIQRLAALTAEVFKRYECDLVVADFVYPYGPASLFAKAMLELPVLIKIQESYLEDLKNKSDEKNFLTMATFLADALIIMADKKKKCVSNTNVANVSFFPTSLFEANLNYLNFDFEKFTPFDISKKEDFKQWAEEYLDFFGKTIENFKSVRRNITRCEKIIKNCF